MDRSRRRRTPLARTHAPRRAGNARRRRWPRAGLPVVLALLAAAAFFLSDQRRRAAAPAAPAGIDPLAGMDARTTFDTAVRLARGGEPLASLRYFRHAV